MQYCCKMQPSGIAGCIQFYRDGKIGARTLLSLAVDEPREPDESRAKASVEAEASLFGLIADFKGLMSAADGSAE